MRTQIRALAIVSLAALLVGCSGSAGPSAAPTADPTKDKLAQIQVRGTLVGLWEADYEPMSWKVEGATRPADTKCQPDQLTGPEVSGYDNDTTKALAEKLGVEICFVAPTWTEITAGSWGDRLDIAYGSGSINTDRMKRLWMTQPYYAVENYFYVRADSPYQVATDLNGKEIGACASCSQEYYLKGELEIPGVQIVLEVQNPQIVTYELEPPGLADVAAGKIDAFLDAAVTGDQAIKDGLALRRIAKPAFIYYPSGFVDKSSGLSATAFVRRVNEIIMGLLTDGTLKALSEKYMGTDYATAAASFNLDSIGQVLP
jgi:polar amino acid transport system substrate-binding protein